MTVYLYNYYVGSWIWIHVKEPKYLKIIAPLVKCLSLGSISLSFIITDSNLWLSGYGYGHAVYWTNILGIIGWWIMSFIIYPMCKMLSFVIYICIVHIYNLQLISVFISFELVTGILQKHFMLRAFSLRLFTSLGHSSLMWVSDHVNYCLIDASYLQCF